MKRFLYLVLAVALLLSVSGVGSAVVVSPGHEGRGVVLDACYLADRGSPRDLSERQISAPEGLAILGGLCLPGPPEP